MSKFLARSSSKRQQANGESAAPLCFEHAYRLWSHFFAQSSASQKEKTLTAELRQLEDILDLRRQLCDLLRKKVQAQLQHQQSSTAGIRRLWSAIPGRAEAREAKLDRCDALWRPIEAHCAALRDAVAGKTLQSHLRTSFETWAALVPCRTQKATKCRAPIRDHAQFDSQYVQPLWKQYTKAQDALLELPFPADTEVALVYKSRTFGRLSDVMNYFTTRSRDAWLTLSNFQAAMKAIPETLGSVDAMSCIGHNKKLNALLPVRNSATSLGNRTVIRSSNTNGGSGNSSSNRGKNARNAASASRPRPRPIVDPNVQAIEATLRNYASQADRPGRRAFERLMNEAGRNIQSARSKEMRYRASGNTSRADRWQKFHSNLYDLMSAGHKRHGSNVTNYQQLRDLLVDFGPSGGGDDDLDQPIEKEDPIIKLLTQKWREVDKIKPENDQQELVQQKYHLSADLANEAAAVLGMTRGAVRNKLTTLQTRISNLLLRVTNLQVDAAVAAAARR